MRGNKNIEVLLQMIILLSISLFLIFLLVTNKINYYVHPRYRIGILICAVMLFIIGVKLITELKKGRHNSNSKKYAIYFLPLAFAMLFPVVEGGNADKVIAKTTKPSSIVGINDVTDKNKESKQNSDVAENETDSSDDYEYLFNEDGVANQEPKDKSLKYKGEVVDGAITIDDEHFASWYYDLFDYLDDFKGKRYKFLAQVYSMDGLEKDEFLAGRYIMVCCATDLTGYGIVTKSDMRKDLKENQWIWITATIDENDHSDTKIPFLKDPVIEKAQAPKDEYVYYNFY